MYKRQVSRGYVTEHDLDPRDLGIERADIQDLLGKDPEHNAGVARRVLAGEPGPVRDIILLNAAAGLAAFALAQDPELQQEPIADRLAAGIATATHSCSFFAAFSTSRVWKAVASRAARAMCPLFAKRVRPRIAPRASGRQCGAKSPENAGTK